MLLLHSWWGMTSSFTSYAELLADAGFLTGCVDLYGGRLAASAEEARMLRSAPRREPMHRTMSRALDELTAHRLADGGAALVGFSMGGHWAVWLAQHVEVRPSAVVIYYATRAVTRGEPVPVLAHFAADDPFVSRGGRLTMERSLHRHAWPYHAYDYPDTSHWFAESAEQAYASDAAALALARTVAFLRDPVGGSEG